jgi:hypothetical protein
MKHTTPTPDFTIKQVDTDCFKVFDRNQHFRRSFGTRKGAEDFIAQQRTGKTAQPAAQAAQVAQVS